MSAPRRILVVCPSWVGDVVMATPALRLLRQERPGAFLGGLVRPGIDALLDGCGFFDQVHIDRPTGVLGPKRVAARIRPLRYDAAVLLTNSFSTALVARIASIPERFGYIRDGRGVLLTWGLRPKRSGRGYATVPAIDAYWRLMTGFLAGDEGEPVAPERAHLSLETTADQERRADEALTERGIDGAFAVLVPGASKPEKRWDPRRFAAIADHIVRTHGLSVLLSGSPREQEILAEVMGHARQATSTLGASDLGVLKAVLRRASLVLTNDTGPRHIAACYRVPTVTLFGPTDHRWTTLRNVPYQQLVLADPTLDVSESANDHPRRCAIDRIDVDRVRESVDRVLERVTPP